MNSETRRTFFWLVLMLGVVIALVAVLIESNTPVHANSAPNLQVGTPSVDDATLYTGNRFTLSVTVTNAGDGASEATTLRYYRSTDSTITGSDTAQGSESVGALAAAGTSDHDGGMTAPSEAGTYYYGACVDSVTDESDTTDNCSSSVTVTVSEPAPDLAVLGIDARDGVETSESFRIGVTVQNLGDGQSAATTLRWLQVTTGESDTELGTDAIRALNLYQANFETIRLTAPSTPGTYTYKACVDSVAGESDTTNNCRSVTVAVEKSTDATLSGLTLSGIDFGTFSSETDSYTAEITNNPAETTVAPTVNHSSASYVIKLGGVTDSDGTVSLSEGSNVITIEVTAEDGQTTKKYTVTVTRLVTSEQNLPSTDATLSALAISGVDFGTFASGTTSYTASVANSVSQTTVTPTVSHSGASYVIKLRGVTDADGTIVLAVGSNVITVEVTAEDGQTSKTYTISVTRAAPTDPGQQSGDATLRLLDRYDTNGNGAIDADELSTAIGDYLEERLPASDLSILIDLYLG